MEFNPENKVVQLCATGMELEGKGKFEKANKHFVEAWRYATTDLERFTAAHYVARHQKNTSDKLKWDKTALLHALKIRDEDIKQTLPSLYLNIGKCYEDLNDFDNAISNYQAAFSFVMYLPDNGYGNMIKAGIENALNRTKNR
jgi:rifampin ADP-ribosylating transferase